ncbi:MAG TPA: hypothetical protein VEI97_15750, partial [bacterium]|nr:hypothetical protein [bacterium]
EGSGGLEWGQDITVDAQGSVVVAGTTGPSDYNATVRKLTGAGVPEWDRGVGADAKGTAVAIVNGTGILFAGEYSGEIDLGFGGPPDMRDGFEDHFLVRLKPNGTR